MSFKFCSLSSGSSGNSEYIETEHSKILIDAGFSGKTIENLLKYINVDPSKLDAIFVTHEHADHIKGIGVLSRRYDLPIIANTETWYAMDNKIGKINDKNIYVFENNRHINFKDLDI
ncbi:MAG: MBL fold metallo-hydrolase, partial [Finegoldia magna]|nr:MBL fold metallo-hydrolase [Finegoldia magna]